VIDKQYVHSYFWRYSLVIDSEIFSVQAS